ncbi:hypothetical protein B0H14DRAFT_3171374 [Mycena olivaceomarginata]|nr:hypothetical protein B0H14DRAFT_3171374 [Mycena olivaceomarginata]
MAKKGPGKVGKRWVPEPEDGGDERLTCVDTKSAFEIVGPLLCALHRRGRLDRIQCPELRGFLPRDKHRIKLAIGNRMRMLTWVHDTTPPPDYPYTRAVSAHSAVIQLYARSGQLPTAETLESRAKLDSCMCRLGCLAVESMHHIFVDCTLFAEWREEAANELVVRTTAKLAEAGIPGEQQQWIVHAAKRLFTDDAETWPLKSRSITSAKYRESATMLLPPWSPTLSKDANCPVTSRQIGTQARFVWRAGYLGAYSGLRLHELREAGCSDPPSLTAGTWTSR